ncbi:MAG: hypothetical protein AAF628_35640 [Planctomycetota bacterium]
MRRSSLVVLKFGGSVLADDHTLRRATHEIYRWRRQGNSVVAVVSALAGTTDRLLGECRDLCAAAAPHTVAATLAGGDMAAAARLGVHLDRAGIPATVLHPLAIGLLASGDPLHATPVGLNDGPLQTALARDGVVVVPGFVGTDATGRTVTLGRGGSDMTALFLADRLGAGRCRLLKDVDGLYARDPNLPGPPPSRYTDATWQDALATDGAVLQHDAVRFAAARDLRFELGPLNGTDPTVIGAPRSRWADATSLERPLRVALLGLGTVGGGVWTLLRGMPELFAVEWVAVRNRAKAEHFGVPAELVGADPVEAAGRDVDIVVELLGTPGVARRAMRAAAARGAHVCTANKAVLAEAGLEFCTPGASVRASAAVGGSMPLLEHARRRGGDGIRAIEAVLNGTTNFVLDRLGSGQSIAAALEEAQRLGFAERDASRDLSGQDAADKLRVLAQVLGWPAPLSIDVAPVTEATTHAAVATPLRQVARLGRTNGRTHASVRLEPRAATDPLGATQGEHNTAVIEHADGVEVVRGKGAGRWPTAEAVVADLLEIARRPERGARREEPVPANAH